MTQDCDNWSHSMPVTAEKGLDGTSLCAHAAGIDVSLIVTWLPRARRRMRVWTGTFAAVSAQELLTQDVSGAEA